MKIGSFFEKYLKKESFFLEKAALMASYTPGEVIYRETQIGEAANILAPALRMERPSNLFIYGKTGTGKTLSIKHILTSMGQIASKNNIKLKPIYVNCKLKRVADTEYRLLSQLIREYGKQVPTTGLPTDEIYNVFYKLIEQEPQMVLLVLDEVDQLTKKIGDEVLYNLTRINAELKHSQICLVGISNSLIFSETLDPRVKSSLSQEELIFPPYNALQIQDILRRRSTKAFKPETVEVGVIEKCAAYAAREHGDVRRAIDLLRVAAELAEREGGEKVRIDHLDQAEKKVESDRTINAVRDQPKQLQCVLYGILLLTPTQKQLFTGEIYQVYQNLCKKSGLNVLTQRRVSDILAELDMLGIINAKIISKGRYGRTREISLSLGESVELRLKEVIEKSLQIE